VNVVLKEMKLTGPMYWARLLFLPTALLVMLIVLPFGCAWFKDFASRSCALEYWYWEPFWFDVSVAMACAMAWVLITFVIAPTNRPLTASLSLLPGTWLAWFIIGESTFRIEGIGMGSFFPTRVPTYLAWWMALATLATLWLLTKYRAKQPSSSKPASRVLGFRTLAIAIALFVSIVVPTTFIFWQFTVYCGTQRMIEDGNEEKAIKRVIRLHRSPLYDLDWTLPRAIARVPFAHSVYSTLVGCPTCKGHWHTPFLLAARHGKLQLLDKIIDLRGSVECGNDKGAAVLHQALISKNASVVGLLLSKGADVNAQMQFPMGSVIHCAVIMDSPPAVIEVLLGAGSEINGTDARGWTPLDWARVWNTNAIPFLTALGAQGGTNHTQKLPTLNRKEEETGSTTSASTATNEPAAGGPI
jgi:hypothetical protein